jgi:hypothetical protein
MPCRALPRLSFGVRQPIPAFDFGTHEPIVATGSRLTPDSGAFVSGGAALDLERCLRGLDEPALGQHLARSVVTRGVSSTAALRSAPRACP